MLRFRQYLKEVAFTYTSTEWEKNFSSLIPNALDVLEVTTKISDIKGIGNLTFSDKIEQIGKYKSDIQIKISGLVMAELWSKLDEINFGEWEKDINKPQTVISFTKDTTRIRFQYGSGSAGSGSDPEAEKEGKLKPKQSAEYEMGFCVAYNYKIGNHEATLEDLNSLSDDELKKIMKDSNVDDEEKYMKSRLHLNKVGMASFDILKEYGKGKKLLHSGKENTPPVPAWSTPAIGVKGGTNGTWKSDIYFDGGVGISIKDESGGQLASGLIGETVSTLYAANKDYLQHGSNDFGKLAKEITERISKEMDIRRFKEVKDKKSGKFIDKLVKGSGNLGLKKNVSGTEDELIQYLIDKFPTYSELKDDWAIGVYGRKGAWTIDTKELFAKQITKLIVTGGNFGGTKWNKKTKIQQVVMKFARKIQKEYIEKVGKEVKDISTTSLHDLTTDIQKVIKQKSIHTAINKEGSALFDNVEWKKFVVFEASSGYRKWKSMGDDEKIPKGDNWVVSEKAIASHILIFDKDYSLDGDINSGKVEKINLNTCAVKAPKVKINASFKTAGSSSPSLRIQQYTPFINKCQTIIENEITEFTNSLLLEGRFGDALKNIGSKLKDLFIKIVEKIKNFITGICKKGFNVILETFGLEIVSATIKGL